MTRAQLDKKPVDVASMFDTVADKYDLTNDVLSLGQDRLWRRAVVRTVAAAPGERILDIAAGTGTSSEPWADREIDVVAADFSLGMLRVGNRRRPDMAFAAADAMRLPFADASFDVVTMSFGLRNVADIDLALREFL
ncbi:MAG: class I SAM-dependent methyltransferase, partial [Terracoccus sp.]